MSEPSSLSALTSWLPAEFAALVKSQTLAQFESQFAPHSFLLFQIAESGDPLSAALERTSTLPGAKPTGSDNIAYETTHCSASEAMDLFATAPQPGGGDCRFIVPIRAREAAETSASTRIWVGRAFNNDIVLRDRTISKCHAYFTYEAERLRLKDAKSRNGTRVNGDAVGSEFVDLAPGDQIAFGSVHAELCSTSGLWQILSSAPG